MDKIMCLTLMMMMIILIGSVNAFTHIVGGSHGWRVPDNTTFFDEWAKPRTFGVGDRLVFPYRPGANNLLTVRKEDYDTCGAEAVIKMYFLGPTIVNLTEPGDYYYYDGIGKHCEAGQKLHIKVGSAEGSSGSDPTPFNLETFGIHTSLGSGPAPAPTTTTTTPKPSSPSAATTILAAHKLPCLLPIPILISIFLF